MSWYRKLYPRWTSKGKTGHRLVKTMAMFPVDRGEKRRVLMDAVESVRDTLGGRHA